MPRPTRFWKLSGAGNDFVLLRGPVPAARARALARRLCDRRAGVGADGLLVAAPGRVLYLNADGSRAFCGNGARCAAWWLSKGRGAVAFALSGVPVRAVVAGGRARVRMPDAPAPKAVKTSLGPAVFVDTGVPHAVRRVKGLAAFDVAGQGRRLRSDRAFGRAGANADFIELGRGAVAIRTYERGVEAETLACGTGAVAAALASGLPSPVRVDARGGRLTVSFARRKDGGFTDVWLEGPVRQVFTGEVTL